MRIFPALILLAQPLLTAPAAATPICPQAALVRIAGQGEGVLEGVVEGGAMGAATPVCQVRLADGQLITAAPADLVPVAAGDTPPGPDLPTGLLRCGDTGLAIAPGLYILDTGAAGSHSQTGAEIRFDSGPLQGGTARIDDAALILTPPGRPARSCTPYGT